MQSYPLDITRIPFSCRRSRCMVFYEDKGAPLDAENGLYLSQSTEGMLGGGAQFYRNKDYLLLTPEKEGKPLEYTWGATTSGVRMLTGEGELSMTFAGDGSLRIFGDGPALLITAKMGFGDVAEKKGETAEIRMDGTSFTMIPVTGSVTVDSHYDLLTYRYTDPVIRFLPDNGKLEIAVFDRSFDGAVRESRPFAECRAETEEAFAAFRKKLTGTEDACVEESYSLWIGPKAFPGFEGDVYPSNVITAVYPRAAEQPVLSLAFRDTDEAFGLITKFAPFITKGGLLPEQASGSRRLYQTASMDHGLAVLELLANGEPSEEQCRKLYDMLATVDEWWVRNRSSDGGISFFYAFRYESGSVSDGIFSAGTPVTAPDLAARMVLQAEALSRLADRIGLTEAAERWQKAAEGRLGYLKENLWKDGRFAARTAEGVAGGVSALCCVPAILGPRLPEDMRQALAETLTGELLIPGRGIRTGAGETDTVLTCLLAAGLIAGGQRDAGEKLLEAVAEAEKAFGLAATYPETGEADCRCAGQYTPAVCAAKLYADSKSR